MEDRILAMCELSNDLLFHKIPRERLGYYVDASLEAGRSAAKCFSGRSIRELYEEYGYYQNTTLNFGFEGAAGLEKMNHIMTGLRYQAPAAIAGFAVVKTDDYLQSVSRDCKTGEETKITLPKSNVIAYSLEGGHSVIVRPSGTEPKIKLYITAVGSDKQDAHKLTDKLVKDSEKIMGVS